MQPQIDEIRGHVLDVGPVRHRIGDHQRHPMLAQQRGEFPRAEAGVPDLDGVAQPAFARRLEPRLLDAAIVLPGELSRFLGIAGQHRQEALQPFGFEAEIRRELPQEGPQLFLQRQHAGGKEVRQGRARLFVAEAQHMGQIARPLDGKDEAGRRGLVPGTVTADGLQRVMRAVDLDGVDRARGEFEFARLGQSLRIEDATPALVAPSRDADSNSHRIAPAAADSPCVVAMASLGDE